MPRASQSSLKCSADICRGEGLNSRRDAALSRGWMNAFRRLSGTTAFRRHWPSLRAEFNAEFVRFCERQLRLGVNPARLVPLTPDSPALALLGAEFAQEWSDHVRAEARRLGMSDADTAPLDRLGARYLRRLVGTRAITLTADDGRRRGTRAAWLIVQTPAEHAPADDDRPEFWRGVVVVHRDARLKGTARELFAWVRPAHRSVGIGDDIWESSERQLVFKTIEDLGGKLIVRYPSNPHGLSASQDRSQWLNFFTRYGFAPPLGQELIEGEDWELELTPTS